MKIPYKYEKKIQKLQCFDCLDYEFDDYIKSFITMK